MTASLRARNLSRATELADKLEVADGLWGRFMGLMGRSGLEPGGGLWLTGNGIHMMFMRFPIDAVFLGRPEGAGAGGERATTGDAGAGAGGEGATAVDAGARPVISVHRGLRAWTGIVPLVRGADGVLELPIGTIERSGTAVGDRIVLEPAGVA